VTATGTASRATSARKPRRRDEEARIWLNGLLAVKNKIGIRATYDLSATPFFLRGSGYQEGTLFPWVVSDFSLIDAIEAGWSRCRACLWPTTRAQAKRPPTATCGCVYATNCPKKDAAPTP
jgi:hypothetical protein